MPKECYCKLVPELKARIEEIETKVAAKQHNYISDLRAKFTEIQKDEEDFVTKAKALIKQEEQVAEAEQKLQDMLQKMSGVSPDKIQKELEMEKKVLVQQQEDKDKTQAELKQIDQDFKGLYEEVQEVLGLEKVDEGSEGVYKGMGVLQRLDNMEKTFVKYGKAAEVMGMLK